MGFRIVTLLAALLTMPGLAQTTTLVALRDTTRPLLIFAGANDPRAQQQLAELAGHADELRSRDVRVVMLNIIATPGYDRSALPTAAFAPDEEAYARQRFHVKLNDFAVVLVGKDGDEKLRSTTPAPWPKLASTIDGMPMRREEMKQK